MARRWAATATSCCCRSIPAEHERGGGEADARAALTRGLLGSGAQPPDRARYGAVRWSTCRPRRAAATRRCSPLATAGKGDTVGKQGPRPDRARRLRRGTAGPGLSRC
ncbi:hypothetical protein AB5I41_12200 [Sphingomonas sp. MMS24-JH45]